MFGMTNAISNWAGGAATTTLGAVQYGIGLLRDRKNKRPTYQIPNEISQNLSQAQRDALQGLPEEQKQQFLSNIERGIAYGLNELGSRKGGLAGLAAINQNQNDAYGNLLAMDSQARMANKDRLYGARQTMADYRDQSFQLNKLNPYYENKARDSAMMGAGMQNMATGFQMGTSSGGGGGQSANPYSGQNFQYGGYGQQGNMYNYNPTSNKYGIVPDGSPSYGNYV